MGMSFNESVKAIDVIRECTINHGASIVPLLLGETGIGKTELVKEYCAEHGLTLITIHVSQIEPSDLTGLYKINKYGKTDNCSPSWLPWLAEQKFVEIQAAGTVPFEELKALEMGVVNPKGGIVFLDEVNRGHEDIRQSLYQLINERKMHTFELPNNYTIVAAANPSNGYETYDFDRALVNRFAWIDFQPTPKESVSYLTEKYATSPVVQWLKHNDEMIELYAVDKNGHPVSNDMNEQKTMSPRIFEQGIILLEEMSRRHYPQKLKNNILRCIWKKEAVEAYLAFDEEAENAIDIQDIFKGKWQEPTKKYVAAQKMDLLSVITSRMARFFTDYEFHSPRTKEEDAMVKNLIAFFHVIPQEQAVTFLNSCVNKYFITKDGKKYFGKSCKDGQLCVNEHHLCAEPEFRGKKTEYSEEEFGSIIKSSKTLGQSVNK